MVQALRGAVRNILSLKIFLDIMDTESQNVCRKKISSYETVKGKDGHPARGQGGPRVSW